MSPLRRTYFFSFFLAAPAVVLLCSCASVTGLLPPPGNAVPTLLPVPEKDVFGFFARVPAQIVADVEFGSPKSLRKAVDQIRRSPDGYAEAGKTLLAVCAGIMDIAYPTEPVNWEIPPVSLRTSYTGAIDSVRNGVYDTSTGNVDFLTRTLPSLLLLTSSQRTQYFGQAQGALTAALEERPDSVLANYLFGVLQRKQGRVDEAIPFLEKAWHVEPACLQTGYALASAYQEKNRHQDAGLLGRTLLEQYPQNTAVIKLCAQNAYAQGDSANAGVYIDRILQMEPGNPEYLLLRAKICVQTSNYIRAVSLLDTYSQTDTEARDYLLLRSQIQREWNRNDGDAVVLMEEALALYFDDPVVILAAAELALASRHNIDDRSAGDFAARILETAPDNKTARSILISQAIFDRDWQTAYQHSVWLIAQGNPAPELLAKHVTICLRLSQMEEARRYAEQLYREYPAREDAVQAYVAMLTAAGDSGAQTLIAAQLPAARAGLKSFLYLEQSKLRSGDADILGDLRKSLIANPRNTDALFELYRFYYDRADYRKASYYLKQIAALNPNDEYMKDLNDRLDRLIL